jgi:hypothetical protein
MAWTCDYLIGGTSGVRTDRRRNRGRFEREQDISERVIFPVTGSQSNGIEDARYDRDLSAPAARSWSCEC